ncbi:MAG: branched-chain amino acid transporter permease [Intestinibacter sp.]
MTFNQIAITIAAMALGTMLTRFLPFILFPANKPTPQYINYLGQILPYSVIALMVVYTLKDVSIAASPWGLPEIISLAYIAVVQIIKRNNLLSMISGTILYMFLVQVVF